MSETLAHRPEPGGVSGGPGARAAGLRLALFSGNYNYTRDGANQALNRLAAYLQREGAVVRVYSPTTATPAFAPCGELVSIPSFGLPGRPEYRVARGLPRSIRDDVIRFNPSIIHLSAPDLLGRAAQKLARCMDVPVVASLHTRFETYLGFYGLDWLRPQAERYLRAFYGDCDRILAPNGPLAELLKDEGHGTRVRLWRRGVNRQQFSPAHRDMAWRRAQGLGDEEVAVLFLGRLVVEKGLDVFAGTLDALRGAGLAVRALVVGDGPARPLFAERLSGGVFTGALQGAELGRAVASADILFNPSRTEAFGNVTLEAMASGLAVVCPEAPSTRELVKHGTDGLLVGTHDPLAYAVAITRLAVDPIERNRMGRAARLTSQGYDWTDSCAAVLEAYRELGAVGGHGRARQTVGDRQQTRRHAVHA